MHAEVAPSSLARTVACPGSLALSKPFLNSSAGEEADEGDAAHWLALEYSEGRRHGLGVKAPNGVEVDADMIAAALLWVATVDPNGVAEIPITIERIHVKCWGTPDRWTFHRPSKVLRVPDFKYGHKYVDPFENWQLIAYIIGLIDLLVMQGFAEDEIRVEPCVIQPRSYHRNGPVQYWRHPTGRLLFATEFREFADHARAQVELALTPFAPTKTGEHCYYCPARHVCETLRRGAATLAEFAGTAQRTDLSSEALGTELAILEDAVKTLNARINGLRPQAEHTVRLGVSVPNYGMEPGQSRLKWAVPVAEVFSAFDAFGFDVRKPVDAITPTQARDRFKIDETVMQAYSSRPPAAMKLQRLSLTATRKVFGI